MIERRGGSFSRAFEPAAFGTRVRVEAATVLTRRRVMHLTWVGGALTALVMLTCGYYIWGTWRIGREEFLFLAGVSAGTVLLGQLAFVHVFFWEPVRALRDRFHAELIAPSEIPHDEK